MLQALYENNIKVVLATSKPKPFALEILNQFDILNYFIDVMGEDVLDGGRWL